MLRLLVISADCTGSNFYRIRQPLNALKPLNVSYNPIIFIPSTINGEKLGQLYELIGQYDLVILQRCFDYGVAKIIRHACDLLGKRMVFETDDDCLHVDPTNPSYRAVMNDYVQGHYPEILRMADAVTVTTKELRDVIHPHNRNVYVLPNNIETIFCGEQGEPKRDLLEESYDEQGMAKVINSHGVVGIPAYRTNRNGSKERIIRIGYTATPSHHADYDTISRSVDKVCEKYGAKVWLVIIGDHGIYDKTKVGRKRVAYIETTANIQQYFWHLRNIDIGIAPLQRTVFNMSKSPLKALEYSMWGTPAVLPNYVTYAREFTSGQNCLMYNNSGEFEDALCELIENDDLRIKLGMAARQHTIANRMENDPKNYEPRHALYQALVQDSRKIVTRTRKDQQ